MFALAKVTNYTPRCSLLLSGLSNGETSFKQLDLHREWDLSTGTILVDGKISHAWVGILYTRTILATALHFMLILFTFYVSVRLGFFSNKRVDTKFEAIETRPDEEVVSVFATFKQSFFFKMLEKYKQGKVH